MAGNSAALALSVSISYNKNLSRLPLSGHHDVRVHWEFSHAGREIHHIDCGLYLKFIKLLLLFTSNRVIIEKMSINIVNIWKTKKVTEKCVIAVLTGG